MINIKELNDEKFKDFKAYVLKQPINDTSNKIWFMVCDDAERRGLL